MKCRDVMNENLVTCQPDDTAGSCAKGMRERGVGFIPVVDDQGRLQGIVTDRDLCIRVLGRGLGPSTRVGDVMSTDWISVRPDDDLEEAERKMAEGQVQRIVVADGNHVIGVVSLQDVISHEDRPERTHRLQRAIKAKGASRATAP